MQRTELEEPDHNHDYSEDSFDGGGVDGSVLADRVSTIRRDFYYGLAIPQAG
jgi:hypothetical protein